MSLVISLIKHKNRSGAKTVPCGTPEVTVDTELFFHLLCLVVSYQLKTSDPLKKGTINPKMTQLVTKTYVGNLVKCFGKIQEDYIS